MPRTPQHKYLEEEKIITNHLTQGMVKNVFDLENKSMNSSAISNEKLTRLWFKMLS